MANNPYVNKVVYGNSTVMDISDSDVTESDVVSGKTFYKASGAKSTGSAVIPDISNCYQTTDTAETDIQDADYFPFYDSSATAKKKSLWSNIKAKLKAYFDAIYLSCADNNVYGAKNLFNLNNTVPDTYTTVTINTTGMRVQSASGYPAYAYNRTNMSDIPKAVKLRLKADVTVYSGTPYVEINSKYSNNVYSTIGTVNLSTGKLDYEFTSPAGAWVLEIKFCADASSNGDLLLSNLMLVSATDTSDDYVDYAMSNTGLTNRIQEIVRTGVTASAGGTVRIPASGTDSRITTDSRCIITPIADIKSDNTPYKFKSCEVSSGYVTLTMAEAISNINIGVQVVKY